MVLPKHIFTILQRAGKNGFSEPVLRDELEGRVGTRPGIVETADALVHLRNLGWIEDQKDELTGDTRWFITPLGSTK